MSCLVGSRWFFVAMEKLVRDAVSLLKVLGVLFTSRKSIQFVPSKHGMPLFFTHQIFHEFFKILPTLFILPQD